MVCFQVDQELGWSLVPNALVAVGLLMSAFLLVNAMWFKVPQNSEQTMFGRMLVIIAVVGLCVLISAGGTIAFAFLIACWDDFVSRKWM